MDDEQFLPERPRRLGVGIISAADLVFVLPDADASEQLFWTSVAERMIHTISAYTGQGVIFTVDTRLRPHGREGALVQYERTIQTAFTEVSNSLIAHQRVRESRVQQQALVTALEDRTRLAYVRYRGGVDTQLNALDADRDLFQAELNLSQVQLNELLTVVQLYKALGGGW